MTCRRIHAIPVGGTEPIHMATTDCWCQPFEEQLGVGYVVTHHAKDGREMLERNHRHDELSPDSRWVNVGE